MKCISIHSGIFVIVLISMVFPFGILSGHASEKASGNDPLRGLEGVFPKIVLNELAIKQGVSVRQVENEVKTKLQAAGILILSLSELQEIPGSPILIVEAECHKMESLSSKQTALYSFIVGVSLFQLRTSDNNIAPVGESTWEAQDRGATFDVADIRHYLLHLVGKFIQSYRSANSKN